MATQPANVVTRRQTTTRTSPLGSCSIDLRWLGVFVLMVVTILVYQPVWRAGFVWDDEMYITENNVFKADNAIRRIWLSTDLADYWPLTATVEWIEWRLWKNRAEGYHAVNVFLHTANAMLLWIVLQRLRSLGAWLVAMLFAIHPVNVATVAWISEQNNTLSMFFFLVTILLYLLFDRTSSSRWYVLSLIAFLLALLSKTTVVMLPVVLLLCTWWLHGSLKSNDLLRSAPFFGLSLLAGITTIWFQSPRVLEEQTLLHGGFLSRLAVACVVPWFYLSKALVPIGLTAVYPTWEVDSFRGISFTFGVLIVASLILFWKKKESWGRPLIFGLGYFLVVLFPVMGLFKQTFHRYSLVADHWQYLAIVAPIALVVAAGVRAGMRCGNYLRISGVLVGVFVTSVFGVICWKRAGTYESSATLWTDTIAKNPGAWVARYNLGNALVQANRIPDAIKQYEQTVRLKPDYLEGHVNLAFALLQAGNVGDAIEHLEQAVRIHPNSVEGHYNLGAVYLQVGRVKDAIGQLDQALQLKPDYLPAQVKLGLAPAQDHRFDQAAQHWETALRLDPSSEDAQRGLERIQHKRSATLPESP